MISPQEPLFDRFLRRLAQYLQSRGIRMTDKRRAVVELILEQKGAFQANDLIAMVRFRRVDTGGNMSRPTIYRTLGECFDAGLLIKTEMDGENQYKVAD